MARKKNEAGIKERILRKAEEYFLNHGYTKTSIEDFVKDLKMSKKTIYQYFKGGKKDILHFLIDEEQQEISGKIDQLVKDQNKNFIEKANAVFPLFASRFFSSAILLKDLQNSEPVLFDAINNFKKDTVLDNLFVLFRQGQKENIVRKDVPLEYLVDFFFESLQGPAFFNLLSVYNITPKEADTGIKKILFEGFLVRE